MQPDKDLQFLLAELNALSTKNKIEIIDILLNDINVCLCDKCDKKIADELYHKDETNGK